ncbi:hypothetical protein HK098_006614, partial [Nowakowskiella sp. JEL0407]
MASSPSVVLIVLLYFHVVTARYGHSALYLPSLGQIYVFGGLPSDSGQLFFNISSGESTKPFTDLTNSKTALPYQQNNITIFSLDFTVVGNPVFSSCVYTPTLSGGESGFPANVICLGGNQTLTQGKPFLFSTTNQKWTPLLTANHAISPTLSGIASAIFENTVVFFGGIDVVTRQTVSSIIVLGPFPVLKEQVVDVTNGGIKDLSRGFAAACGVRSGVVVGFGNNGNTTLSSVVLITRGNTVTSPVFDSSLESPGAREGCTAVKVSNTVVLFFGGRSDSGEVSSEVWELDTSADLWRWTLISKVFGYERAFHTATMVGRIMVVWGGVTVGGGWLDDQPVFFDIILRIWVPMPDDFFAFVTPVVGNGGKTVSASSTVGVGSATGGVDGPVSTSDSKNREMGDVNNTVVEGICVGLGGLFIAMAIIGLLRHYRKSKDPLHQDLDQGTVHFAIFMTVELKKSYIFPSTIDPPPYEENVFIPAFHPEQIISPQYTLRPLHTHHFPPLPLLPAPSSNTPNRYESTTLDRASTEETVFKGESSNPQNSTPNSATTSRSSTTSNSIVVIAGSPDPTPQQNLIGIAECTVEFHPSKNDEMEMKVGDVIEIFEVFDDGWGLGRNKRLVNGTEGDEMAVSILPKGGLPNNSAEQFYSIKDGSNSKTLTDLTSIVGSPTYASCLNIPIESGADTGFPASVICMGGDQSQVGGKPYLYSESSQKWAPLVSSTISLPPQIIGMIGAVFENKAVFFGGLDPTTRAPYANIFTLGPFPSLKDQTIIANNPAVPDLARGHAASAAVGAGIVVAFGNNGQRTVSSAYLITRGNTVIYPNSVALNNGTLPTGREGVTAVNITSSKVLFYGGRSGSTYFNEIWELDTSNSEQWTWQMISKESGFERAFHTANLVGRIMVVFGGLSSGANPTDDNPIFYDTVLKKWVPFPGDFYSTPLIPSVSATAVGSLAPTQSVEGKGTNGGNNSGTVGGLIGGIFGAVIVLVGILIFTRNRRRKQRNSTTVVIQPENTEPLEEIQIDNVDHTDAPPAYEPSSPDSGIVFTEQQPSTPRMDGVQPRSGSLRPHSGYESIPSQRSSTPVLFNNNGSGTDLSNVRNSVAQTLPVSLTPEVTYINGQPYIPMVPYVPNPGETLRPVNRGSVVSDNSGGRPTSTAYSNASNTATTSTAIPIPIPQVPNDVVLPQGTAITEDTRTVIARGVCVRNHKPLMPDELEMMVGDEIEVYERFEDGWGRGRNVKTNSREGVFPMDTVKINEEEQTNDRGEQENR